MPISPLGPSDVQEALNVSRETLEKLDAYVDLLVRWQAKINLVSKHSLGDVWRRHILDSIQLMNLVPEGTRIIADIGAGAGLPGIPLALAMVGNGWDGQIHLIESDTRKCAFMREAIRITQANAIVHNLRVEDYQSPKAEVITARALAPLDALLTVAKPIAAPGAVCLFLKGKSAKDELISARESWHMDVNQSASLSDPEGKVLIISEFWRGSP